VVEDVESGQEPVARKTAESPDPPGLKRTDPPDLHPDREQGEIEDTRSAKRTATEARNRVARTTPEDAKRAASRVAHEAQARPLPAIGIAAATGFVLGRLLGRR
jgi:hypothetical protein